MPKNGPNLPHDSLGRAEHIIRQEYLVKVVLSPQHEKILDNICVRPGQSESKTLRVAFLEYAKSLSLIMEKVHGEN